MLGYRFGVRPLHVTLSGAEMELFVIIPLICHVVA